MAATQQFSYTIQSDKNTKASSYSCRAIFEQGRVSVHEAAHDFAKCLMCMWARSNPFANNILYQ